VWRFVFGSCGRCGRRMAYREVSVIEVNESVRWGLEGWLLCEVTMLAGVGCETVCRYVHAARSRVGCGRVV
jgi:hypothetical protein